jgi:hypothetical protein
MTLVWTPGFNYDTNASAYIDAVEAADSQALETATRYAINDFVIGCKSDSIWNAIKASCILSGARTLAGALIPLTGTAPTNFNFVSGDYNRKTGLVGNGSTKYLDSNRNNNTDPQNNNHNAVYATTLADSNFLTGATGPECNDAGSNGINGSGFSRSRSTTGSASAVTAVAGFFGISRSVSSNYNNRVSSTNETISVASNGLFNTNVLIYRRSCSGSPAYTASRIAFYSIGENLDLALLDARVTALINAFAAAIP